jgi:hypothetical protein
MANAKHVAASVGGAQSVIELTLPVTKAFSSKLSYSERSGRAFRGARAAAGSLQVRASWFFSRLMLLILQVTSSPAVSFSFASLMNSLQISETCSRPSVDAPTYQSGDVRCRPPTTRFPDAHAQRFDEHREHYSAYYTWHHARRIRNEQCGTHDPQVQPKTLPRPSILSAPMSTKAP